MTDEILEKANALKSEIYVLIKLQDLLNEYIFSVKRNRRKKAKLLAKKMRCEDGFEVYFPRELQAKILHLVDEYRFDKELEYQALGKEIQNG